MAQYLDLLSLTSPVGSGQPNRPDDVEALDEALRRGAVYVPPAHFPAPVRYITGEMIDGIEKFQEQNGLKSDRVVNPGGPTERAINNILLNKPQGASLFVDPIKPLSADVGNGRSNAVEDIRSVRRGLGALEYLPEDPFDNPPGSIDGPFLRALRKFQTDNGLTPDGWAARGGETEAMLRENLSGLEQQRSEEWGDYWSRAAKAGYAGDREIAGATSLETLSNVARQRLVEPTVQIPAQTKASWHRPIEPGQASISLASLLPGNPSREAQASPDNRADPNQGIIPVFDTPADYIIPGLLVLGAILMDAARRQSKPDDASDGTDRVDPPSGATQRHRLGSSSPQGTPRRPLPTPPPPLSPPIQRIETRATDGLIVESRRGDDETRLLEAKIAVKLMATANTVAKAMQCTIIHDAGGSIVEEENGEFKAGAQKEQRQVGPLVPGVGHSFPDMIFRAKETERRLHINTYTPLRRGGPNWWERKSGTILVGNVPPQDIVVLVPKLTDAEHFDPQKFATMIAPYLVEICTPFTGRSLRGPRQYIVERNIR